MEGCARPERYLHRLKKDAAMDQYEVLISEKANEDMDGIYTVFFVIHADTVRIARVLYSASDIRRRLSEE